MSQYICESHGPYASPALTDNEYIEMDDGNVNNSGEVVTELTI
jgi:hypothetical protein